MVQNQVSIPLQNERGSDVSRVGTTLNTWAAPTDEVGVSQPLVGVSRSGAELRHKFLTIVVPARTRVRAVTRPARSSRISTTRERCGTLQHSG